MLQMIKRVFGSKAILDEERKETINRNYVCMVSDPINTMDDLRKGEWNRLKVREGIALGMLRYPTQQEVEQANEIGRIK